MDDKLLRFFKKIELDEKYYSYFDKVSVKQVVVNKKNKSWTIHLNMEELIPVDVYDILLFASKKIVEADDIYFVFELKNKSDLLEDYFNYFFNKKAIECPMLASIMDNEISFNNDEIEIEVLNKIEKDKIDSVSNSLIKSLKNVGIDATIKTKLNEEKRELVKMDMKKADVVIEKNDGPRVILGSPIKGKTMFLKDIMSEENNTIFEVSPFDIEFKETRNGGNIFTMKVTDNTDSIIAKLFTKEKDVVSTLSKNINKGSWYKIRGYIKHDDYLRELVLNIRDIETTHHESVKRVDEAPKKRVELHLHTKMSQMDGLIDFDKSLIAKMKEMGFTAFGLTDKNTVQEFPKIFNNKGDIKVLFGSEVFVVNDDTGIIVRGNDEKIKDTTFVVFDFETTGLNAGSGDSIIEIGAVKIKNGEIIDRYNELINPGHKLKEVITNITNITDEMLKDKDNEENAFLRFKEWYKDLPMVAHNARFDCSFIEMCYKKYNLGEFTNTVLDTMEISRALNPEASRHSLSACVKRYGVEFSEEGHHRADYDAEGTAYLLDKMLKTTSSSFVTLNDLNRLVDKSQIHKMGRPFHITLYALNDIGLKNLFKIISLCNTKYLYKTPRILKSEVEKLREGVLIGSGCINGEIFREASTKTEEELANMMKFYDFIEVNPPSIIKHLIDTGDFNNMNQIHEVLNKIITTAEKLGKLVCATGDVHTLDPEDNIYREILVAQKNPGGGLHPLNKKSIKEVPNAYLMTTEEMLEEFSFLDKEKAYEIVVTNTNKIADMFNEEVHVLRHGLCSPKMENSAQKTKDLVYGTAKSIYGEELPKIIEERLEKELGGIIGGEYDVIYLISQMLVKKSNDDGYLVGSRGSVGSSLVATFMGITEVNPLPPHYVCPKCKKSIFELDGKALNLTYGSGFDMPDRKCVCGEDMTKNGQDIPFETFLGFNGDKTPDIDLNFSGEYQAQAHNYTKVLFGEENVYRAGTVSTIATKTAFGFVKAWCEQKGIMLRNAEIERLAIGITGVKRTSGQHPGGIVVVGEGKDIYDFTPFQFPAENTEAEWFTTHFEYHDIEENLLKLDILGHDDPTVLKYLSDDEGVDINDIPLDDQKVLSIFRSPEALGVTKEDINCPIGTLGIPEFGTNFVIKMVEEAKPSTFADLIKISGLSHGTDVWNGNARDLILNGTCEFKEVIGCRDDIMVYLIKQGLEKGQAFKTSEFIRKGKSVKEPEKWEELKAVMREHNVPDWYIGSCEKIKYMFPKAHASAYVTMAFRVAWFKVYKPLSYYRVYLSIREHDFDLEAMANGENAIKSRIGELLNKGFDASNKESSTLGCLRVCYEAVKRGIRFEKISISESDATMFKKTKDGKGLIPPFIAIDGMGEIAAKNIVKERENRPYVSIEDLQYRGKVSQTLIDKMRGMGSLDDMPESSQLSLF